MQYLDYMIYEYKGVSDCVAQIVLFDEEENIIFVKDTFDVKVPGLMYVDGFGQLNNNSRRDVIGFTVVGDDDRKLVPLVK